MYKKLSEPRHVFVKLQLIHHTGMNCAGTLRQGVEEYCLASEEMACLDQSQTEITGRARLDEVMR